jgi:phage-related baseplate assembly protein
MISDLFTPVTVEDAKASIYAQLERMGVRTANWKPGGVVRTIIAIVAVLVSTFSELVALAIAQGWLSTATGQWLTNKGEGDFGTSRIAASAAGGVLRLTNTAGGSFSVGADELIVGNPTTGAQYRNVAAFTLSPLGVVDIEIVATEAGAWTSSAAGTVTELVTPLTGVTCSNPDALVGTDEESDALYRERCMAAPAMNSPAGPSDAYSYAVRTWPRSDGTPTGITRTRTVSDGGTGGITVVAATGSGSPLSADLSYLQERLINEVLTECATVSVVAASPIVVPVSFVAYTSDAAVNTTAAKAAATTALQKYIASVPIGGYRIGSASGVLPVAGLAGAVQGAITGCFKVAISSLAADVALDPNEVAVSGAVTPSVQVERQQ